MQEIEHQPAFQRPSGFAYLNNNQLNIPVDTDTLVALDAIHANFDDAIENIVAHRITPVIAGFYSIVGQVSYIDCDLTDAMYFCKIKISGAAFAAIHEVPPCSGGHAFALCCLPTFYLSATDYVELFCRVHSTGATVDVHNGANETYLSLQRVR